MIKPMYRLAHLSDLHFADYGLTLADCASKRILGELNGWFNRRKSYGTDHLRELLPFLKSKQVNGVAITGDLTTTAKESEFKEALQFTMGLEMPTALMPGNHDFYTRQSEKQALFWHAFPNRSLQEEGVELRPLCPGWSLLLIQCAKATGPFQAWGEFSRAVEDRVREKLAHPSSGRVIVCCHFPLYFYKNGRSTLRRREALLELLLEHPEVVLYLHGHDHKRVSCRFDRLQTLSSGSIAKKESAPFSIIELSESGYEIHFYERSRESPTWHECQASIE